jgi:hypothetical protein
VISCPRNIVGEISSPPHATCKVGIFRYPYSLGCIVFVVDRDPRSSHLLLPKMGSGTICGLRSWSRLLVSIEVLSLMN